MGERYQTDADVRLGGDQIEYDDEDPKVRELYEAELSRAGIELRMDFRSR